MSRLHQSLVSTVFKCWQCTEEMKQKETAWIEREAKTSCCVWSSYLRMPDEEDKEKDFPPKKEFLCSWDALLVSTVHGFCSGI